MNKIYIERERSKRGLRASVPDSGAARLIKKNNKFKKKNIVMLKIKRKDKRNDKRKTKK